jgi:hypothetical protein
MVKRPRLGKAVGATLDYMDLHTSAFDQKDVIALSEGDRVDIRDARTARVIGHARCDPDGLHSVDRETGFLCPFPVLDIMLP